MDKQAVTEKVKANAKEGKIACTEALRISGEEGISPAELGTLLNELKIKIRGCQLGCFP